MVSNQDSTEGKDSEDFSIPVLVDPKNMIFQVRAKIFCKYSPEQANLQFSLRDTQILFEIVVDYRRNKNTILVILEVLNFDFLEKIPQSKVLKIPKFSLGDTQILRAFKFCNFGRSKTANWSF